MSQLDKRPCRGKLRTSREVCSILTSNLKPIVARMPSLDEKDVAAVCKFLRFKLEHFDEVIAQDMASLETPERLYIMIAIGGMCLDAFNGVLARRGVTVDALGWLEGNSQQMLDLIRMSEGGGLN